MGVSPSLLATVERTYASYEADLSVPEIVYAEEVALALAMYQYEAQDEVRRIARSYASLSEYDTKEICRVADFSSSTGEFAIRIAKGIHQNMEFLKQVLPVQHEVAQKINTPLHYRVRLLLSELARDWSVEGEVERKQSYEPLLKELPSERCRVLVPGCGTGRLAYDVAVLGHDVEANDFDIMKLAAANAVVSRSTDDPFVIEPYCLDTCNRMKRDDHIRKPGGKLAYVKGGGKHAFKSNDAIDYVMAHPSMREMAGVWWAAFPYPRFELVSVPDCDVDREALGRISVNGFEFTEAYGVPAKHESFDIVLTAAFIDTAPNVFVYIKTIANVLKPGAKWANTGPLGWLYDGDRFNSGRDGKFLRRLELSHEELMEAISAKWFDIERSELVPGCRYCGDRRTMLETDLTFVNFVAIRNNTPVEY
ncbi:hypothetical protein FOZ63_023109 [Perkinsus olseni]|uniref:carnosine N-methyltransferase n=1 Tax=Perkinsus olseni TaxID=32597 RepID=A0A7J6TC20_PEROL|nr:hypothetical protein FOZ63_023109 [Perkinsus olseni]